MTTMTETPTMKDLLVELCEKNGSDLHITAGSPPRYRLHGRLENATDEILSPADSKQYVYSILTPEQIAVFEQNKELDFSFGVESIGRFRTNVFMQRGAVGAVMRTIPTSVMSVEELGLPTETCHALCNMPKGMILVTGATGSGKSTTQASMIDFINQTRANHIVTVEDPIEYLHHNKLCHIDQREVGQDTHTFAKALRSVLRQDPDVVLVGEMRDLETIEAALVISETGHLTLGTLHTSDAVQTINRIVDVFPAHQQQQIRTQLSFTLQAVICQELIESVDGGRALACEVLIANSAVRAHIREGKTHQLYSVIQTNQRMGMVTMNQSLSHLVRCGKVSAEMAVAKSTDPEELIKLIQMG